MSAKPKKLILMNNQSPGDLVVLSAALRDLHRSYPGQFLTDIRSNCPEIFENNPYLTPLQIDDPEVESIYCEYPEIQKSNQIPVHFLEGFVQDLNRKLNLSVQLTEFRGDIHLTDQEKASLPDCADPINTANPFWLVTAGGKFDFTIKWWNIRRWQRVVDALADRIQFVQIGAKGHYHPALKQVVDLRGKTTLRELIRLVYHSSGVLCPVTMLMHLAAAVDRPSETFPLRPCVVVAGAREPAHWEAYPSHQFIHTVGTLSCCAHGGCWRSRTLPLNDGSKHDSPSMLCQRVSNRLPACMDMITPDHVIERISFYLSTNNIIPEKNHDH